MTVEYLKAILEQEKLKNEQLEEECGLVMNLLLRKHYRNISESQFCSSMRRKHVGANLRKYKSDSFVIDDKYTVSLAIKRSEANNNNNNNNSNNNSNQSIANNNEGLPEGKRMKIEQDQERELAQEQEEVVVGKGDQEGGEGGEEEGVDSSLQLEVLS